MQRRSSSIESEALIAGMNEKAEEFKDSGGEIYHGAREISVEIP